MPDFEGKTLILAIPVLTQTPSAESASASSKGHNAGSSRTWAGKHKVTATPPASKKARKVMSKKSLGIKINDSAPNPSPAPTPPSHTWGGFTMRRSKR
jgi:hypothetical protein